MGTAELKSRISEYLEQADNEMLLLIHEMLKQAFSNEKGISFSDDEKKAIDEALSEVEAKGTKSHDEVMAAIRTKYPQVFGE